jgi:hypothetical protein
LAQFLLFPLSRLVASNFFSSLLEHAMGVSPWNLPFCSLGCSGFILHGIPNGMTNGNDARGEEWKPKGNGGGRDHKGMEVK